jgi:predicted lactoylglutathione lyase
VDHFGLLVSDVTRAKTFYKICLSALNWEFRDYGARGGVFRKSGSPPFYLTPASVDASGVHVAFGASSRKQVDEFYATALLHGATGNGAPGLRPDYGEGYYAAFVLDANRNNLEAVYHEPKG